MTQFYKELFVPLKCKCQKIIDKLKSQLLYFYGANCVHFYTRFMTVD